MRNALINDAKSAADFQAISTLGVTDPDRLKIDWVSAEFSAAFHQLRTGAIEATSRSEALTMFACLSNESLAVKPVSREQFRLAARLADQYALGLGAADALHLAVCAEQSAVLCTLDRRLDEAAAALGVKTALL